MSEENSGVTGSGAERADAGIGARTGEVTGAYLVLLAPDEHDAGMAALRSIAGVATATHIRGVEHESAIEPLTEGVPVVFDEFGVAVVTVDPGQRQPLLAAAAESPAVLAVEPERVVYALDAPPPIGYLAGYRDGVSDLVARLAESGDLATPGSAASAALDETRLTWGLQAIRAAESRLSGKGVRVAVLDTGVAPLHRDLANRTIKTASFIVGETVDDGHGHGTHCIGTSCGPRQPQVLPRYGVASEAEIYAGKVLNNAGRGSDGGILAGIGWALGEGARVISMSLGAPTSPGTTFSPIFEAVARLARARGTVIVAAAGNESRRPGAIGPVGHPANCPSILAVAALNSSLTVAPFSCAGVNPDGGQVDIAAPGVDVLSSWPEPTGYRRLSGTSMATPHVAGVLALLAEANPAASGAELVAALLAGAKRLPLPSADAGAGLVQAP